jgi:HSP20 family protein
VFKIFSFGFGDVFNLNNIEKVNRVMHSFLDNIDISEFTENYIDTFSTGKVEAINESNFIELKQYEDMYLLTVDLEGIDLRELSIRYEPGIIEINLNRSEIEKSSLRQIYGNRLVKKSYYKKFENIEEIDTSQILKSIDNGILSMRMQKKYELLERIIDVDSYEDN